MSDLHIQVSVYSSGVADRPTRYDKATKSEARYRPANVAPEGEQVRAGPRGWVDELEIPRGAPSAEGDRAERCGTCEHYSGHRGCEIVAGVIDPEYVCDWWSDDAEPS